MATTFDITNAVTTTVADAFIPQVWSMEIIAAYKTNVVMAGRVSRINHNGKKGNTINIPSPTRGSATAKSGATIVTLIAHTDTNVAVSLDKHYHYARLVEDITELQALVSLRQFFVKDAGYALAKAVDDQLLALAATWNSGTAYSGAYIGGDGSTAYSTTANTNTGNGTALSDAGIRRTIQRMDDNDVPGRDRSLLVPPVTKNTILSLARFTEQAFTGESGDSNSIRNGYIANLYGVEAFVSSNCVTITATDASTQYRVCLMFQKESIVLAEQMTPRVRSQDKLEALGTLIVADTIFGVKSLRSTGAFGLVVPV